MLCVEGKLSAASTAAGPAFEGARIMHGMRGTAGAIEKVVVDGRLRINVIGDVPPAGLCGSALIDAAAELLRHGMLYAARPPGVCPAKCPPGVVARSCPADRALRGPGRRCNWRPRSETAHGRPILLTQRDLRELQLASGGDSRRHRAACCARSGLEPQDLDRVLVGGGFGNFIRRSNAQRIGLLPWRIEHWRIRYQGNTSLAGAAGGRFAAVRGRSADEMARRIEHVDLSRDAEFATAFADAMIFPESESRPQKRSTRRRGLTQVLTSCARSKRIRKARSSSATIPAGSFTPWSAS